MQPDYPHADYIRRLIDAAPPLSEEQRARIATIFRSARTNPAPAELAAPGPDEQGAVAA